MHRDPLGPGQESVWDYPRPPRLEAVPHLLRVVHGGREIARTRGGFRVLETSHPPTYYFPRDDVDLEVLTLDPGPSSVCEWKGAAIYAHLPGPRGRGAAWTYPSPYPGFEPIAGAFAFYASRVDEAWVGEHRATPQPGAFYGGWVTPDIRGPFKGVPGSAGW